MCAEQKFSEIFAATFIGNQIEISTEINQYEQCTTRIWRTLSVCNTQSSKMLRTLECSIGISPWRDDVCFVLFSRLHNICYCWIATTVTVTVSQWRNTFFFSISFLPCFLLYFAKYSTDSVAVLMRIPVIISVVIAVWPRFLCESFISLTSVLSLTGHVDKITQPNVLLTVSEPFHPFNSTTYFRMLSNCVRFACVFLFESRVK